MKTYIIFGILMLQNIILMAQSQSLYIIHVAGSCGMCGDRIETAAASVTGVQAVEWDAATNQLAVIADPNVNILDIHKVVSQVGHDTELMRADAAVYEDLPGCCAYRTDAKDTDRTVKVSTSFHVSGVCGMCQNRIETTADKIEGISNSSWDLSTGILMFNSTPNLNLWPLLNALTDAGHDTQYMDATDQAYDDLHGCCKYRDQAIRDQHKPNTVPTPDTPEENHHEDDGHNHSDEVDVFEKLHDPNFHVDHTHSPNIVEGMVYERDFSGDLTPLVGVNIYWATTQDIVSTDLDGFFKIDRIDQVDQLVMSYIGYETDTIAMGTESMVAVVMRDGHTLDAVEVTHRQRSTQVSFIGPIKTQKIGEKELLKAACCNLSESFETTPSVDVSQTDAVTGTKKIEMLGLKGANIQITRENMPYIRGLSSLYGFEYIPGAWIAGIQLNQGTGSVVNGYESITGQINVELKKPFQGDRGLINIYAGQDGRYEANLFGRTQVSEKWHTAILFHQNYRGRQTDNNKDGFKDNPLTQNTIAINRWQYLGENGWMGQFGIGGISTDAVGGQFDFDDDNRESGLWGSKVRNKRFEGWGKLGHLFQKRPYASFGVQVFGYHDDQEGYFGDRDYNARQTGIYANFIYQSIIDNTDHSFKTGASFQWDKITENVIDTSYLRNEKVPGVFGEYSYKGSEKWSVVLGLRADVHNNYGLFVTPRLHLIYNIKPTSVVRLSGGRGQRTASIFAENIGMFASSRQIIISSSDNDNPYGLTPEVAWNVGLNLTQEISLNNKPVTLELDLYRTEFTNQVVVDYDQTARAVELYNLDGRSNSTSIQATVNYEVAPRFDVRLAYRYNYAEVDYRSGRLQRPLSAAQRAFINLAYATENNWAFDFTLNRIGDMRLPNTSDNPEQYQLVERSEAYYLGSGQITKSWAKKFDLYSGVQNLFNYKQDQAILSSENPWSENFDASIIYAPIFGRNIYVGLRYRFL